ncbi:scarecrow-like protein 28 [Phalaenopsis equestris]|uniref:scarecrow-like protein 28 n=1 Tax=Phalaenopsis equestris TaxID=78828 RepID=UPI0009E32B4E|nr:scarecrow-like protein 28 [Phalaenopsis equestris]
MVEKLDQRNLCSSDRRIQKSLGAFRAEVMLHFEAKQQQRCNNGTAKDLDKIEVPNVKNKPYNDSSENQSWREIIGLSSQRENSQTEDQSLELVNFLTHCAEAISTGDHASINYFLSRLGEMASPTGTTVHRLAAYFTEGLAITAVKLWPHIFSINPPRDITEPIDDDEATALRLLDQATPIPKFIHFTLNERLMRAFEGKDRVHIIDLDIKQGLQWPSLFQSLASRPNPPKHVRITGIGESKPEIQSTGARLAGLADSLNLPFQFHAVVDQLEDVRLWMLHVKEGECLAVNCVLQLHKMLYDDTGGSLRDLMCVVRSTNPAIVLVAEEEADHNHHQLEVRFANSLNYYAAVFDALNVSLPEDSSERLKIEKMFARKIRSIIAREGTERHESFSKWSRKMKDCGFDNVGIGDREKIQSQVILRMYSDSNFSVERKEADGEALCLKWQEQQLYTVSAWAPMDVAGSSAVPQPD